MPAPAPTPVPPPGDSLAVVRVVISPASVLLTEPGQTVQLFARPLDAAGNPVNVPVEWRSSNPDAAVVTPDGNVTSMIPAGSSQITAIAGGVTSMPVLAVAAQLVPGALPVADEQVVTDPAPTDASAEYGLGYRYRVTLAGYPSLKPGDLLVGAGGKPIGGRVIEVTDDGANKVVVLEVVPLNALFSAMKINESIDLSHAPAEISPVIAKSHEMTTDADGTMHFAPRLNNAKAARRALLAHKLGPFECEVEPGFPLTLTVPPVFSASLNTTLDFRYDIAGGGFQKLLISGEPKVSVALSPMISLGANGAYKCKAELATIRVPVGGPLSLVFSPIIGIDAGFDISGNLTEAQVGFEASAALGCKAVIGVDCSSGECKMVNTLENTSSAPAFKPTLPDRTNLSDNFNLKLSAQVFGSVELYVGNPFLNHLRFETFQIKIGPKLELDLSSAKAQADKADIASSFKLSLAAEAGIGNSVQKLKDIINVSFVELKLTEERPLAESPTGTFAITPATVEPGDDSRLGDLATFSTVFDKSTFLTFEVIGGVEYYWIKNGALEPARPSCNAVVSGGGQTIFECQTDFLTEHEGEQTFHAFYKAKLFGIPLPFPLEVNKDAKAKVKVEKKKPAASFQGLGFLSDATTDYAFSTASALSADGSVVGGYSRYAYNPDPYAPSQLEAFRWTSGGGMVRLGFLSNAPSGNAANASSTITQMSPDGNVVVGYSSNANLRQEAFRWKVGEQMIGLGFLTDATTNYASSTPFALSDDGNVVMGISWLASNRTAAFRWTLDGGMIGLGFLSDAATNFANNRPAAMSADGSVIIGTSDLAPSHYAAYRWTSGGGMAGLGFLHVGYPEGSSAAAMSADGSVVVGFSINGNGKHEAFRWTAGDGMVGLGYLPNVTLSIYLLSEAMAVSADGNVVVGQSTNAANRKEAFRWTSGGGMVGMGFLSDASASFADSRPLRMSADGSVVIGYSRTTPNTQDYFIWDAAHGMRSLRQALIDDYGLGDALAGWQLTSATMTPDGRTIVGRGVNPAGQSEAWRAVLGKP